MRLSIRPVIIGLLLGHLSFFFGISWAVYITVNHENIHKTFESSRVAALTQKFVITGLAPAEGMSHEHGGAENSHEHVIPAQDEHSGNHAHEHAEQSMHPGAPPVEAEHTHGDGGVTGPHSDPVMEAAHLRLTRGHVHSMGLGLVTIAISLVLAATATGRLATIASACVGFGGLLYPFSWIVMGYRTPAMGMDAAAESIVPVVALSVPLVLLGIALSLYSVLRTALKG